MTKCKQDQSVYAVYGLRDEEKALVQAAAKCSHASHERRR